MSVALPGKAIHSSQDVECTHTILDELM